MEAKEAVRLAKEYISELLKEEGMTNLGLEELEFIESENSWRVTLGFSRPWNTIRGPLSTITGENSARRAYRVLTVRASDGEVLSVKKREMAD